MQYALIIAIERLASPDLKVRKIAARLVEKMKSLHVKALPEDSYNEIVHKWIHLPQMLFNNLANSNKLTSHQRRRLCRIPTVQATLVQDMKSVRWLLNRMSQQGSKADSAVEYFERVTELRKTMGIEGSEMQQLNMFYRRLGRQLALPPRVDDKSVEESKSMAIRLFPTLYAMDKRKRMQIIDCCVGTPLLTHPLNILIGQPLALLLIILDGLAVAGLLYSTFRVRLDELDHGAPPSRLEPILRPACRCPLLLTVSTPNCLDGAAAALAKVTSLLPGEPASAEADMGAAMEAGTVDSSWVFYLSLYVTLRELVSMWSFHLVSVRAGHQGACLAIGFRTVARSGAQPAEARRRRP